jgi:DNA-binding SARP family transcriptional activator
MDVTMRLKLLGGASLVGEGVYLERLERRTAGLLAYLAMEGTTPRSRLAGLLWPCSREKAARNNLAQVLLRLRKLVGRALVLGVDTLSLTPALAIDVRGIDVEARGALLDGYDYDGASEFEAWLYASRERIARARRRALEEKATEAEERGDHVAAIAWAERLVIEDPLAESAHRRVIRLYLASGDAASAMRAFKRCKDALKKELGIEPSDATRALALEILRRPRRSAPPQSEPPQSAVVRCGTPVPSCPSRSAIVAAPAASARCV